MSVVLVGGSEGSLMQSVIPLLLQKGHTVVGVDNLVRYGRRLHLTDANYNFIKGDLTDLPTVEMLIKTHNPEYIIQAAALIYGVGGFNKYCADILGQDVSLHNNVLRMASKYGVKKVVYISSSMVYENCPQDLNVPVTEDMPDNYIAPYTEYGLSKFTGERLSIAFSKQYNLPYTIWRPFNIITPYEKAEEQLGYSHVFADFIKSIIVDGADTLPILGSGDQIRCFTWIGEVAQAIVDYSFSTKTDNKIYNLGNPEPISMRELANKIRRIAHEEFRMFNSPELSFHTIDSYKNDVMVRVPSVEKAKAELKWEAKMKVNDSIRFCVKEAIDSMGK